MVLPRLQSAKSLFIGVPGESPAMGNQLHDVRKSCPLVGVSTYHPQVTIDGSPP